MTLVLQAPATYQLSAAYYFCLHCITDAAFNKLHEWLEYLPRNIWGFVYWNQEAESLDKPLNLVENPIMLFTIAGA